MRSRSIKHKHGDMRNRTAFLLTPKTLPTYANDDTYETRWLERASWEQEYYQAGAMYSGWRDVRWSRRGTSAIEAGIIEERV